MRSIVLPVSRFSKKILLHDFGAEPFQLSNTEIITQALRAARPAKVKITDVGVLNDTATILVSDDIARHIQDNLESAGINLHRYHREHLYATCSTTAMLGGQGYAALKRYFDLYEIGEDDFSLETAQRGLSRFREKSEKKSLQKNEHTRRRLTNPQTNKPIASKKRRNLIDAARIEAWHTELWRRICEHIKHPPQRLSKQLRAYLYIEVGGYTARQASQIIGPKGPSCFESCKRMKQGTLRRKPWLKKMIQEVVGELALIKTISPPAYLLHATTACY